MSGNKVVLDSNFLIFLSKGLLKQDLLWGEFDKYYVSIITFIEVYAYDFSDERQKLILDETFNDLEIIDLTSDIAAQTIIYRKSKVKKIKLPDAMILASAKVVGAELLTDNITDFVNIDPTVNIRDLADLKV